MERNEKFTLLDKVVCTYIFIDIFILPSALLYHFLGSFRNYFAMISFLGITFCVISMKKNFNLRRYLVIVILIAILCGLVPSIVFVDRLHFWSLRTIIFSLIVLILYKEKHLEMIVKAGTLLYIILLIGAFIGFSYAISGGPPIYEFPNPDERTNYVFLTTCTNLYISQVIPGMTNIIRPSGIYDEPGTFSFFLCILIAFRVITGKNDILSFFMLLAGNITFSVAHYIFFVFFNLYMLGKYYKKKIFILYIATIVLASMFLLYQYYDIFDRMLFRRLQGTALTENNRSVQVEGCLRILKNAPSLFEVIMFGDREIEEKGDFILTNPLGPLVYHGLLISWIYYLCMAIFLLGGIISKKYRFILWAILLVYAQRPFYFLYGASTAFYIIAVTTINIIKNKLTLSKNGQSQKQLAPYFV